MKDARSSLRREDDTVIFDGEFQYCRAHEQNTKDLARMKAWMTFLAFCVPIALLVIGYFVGNTDKNISEMKADIKPLIATASENKTTIKNLKEDMQRFETMHPPHGR
jgi:hypothetical protein